MSKIIEIEATVDVYIDEYVHEISDEALFEEALFRLENDRSVGKSGGMLKNKLGQTIGSGPTIATLIAAANNLSIVQAAKLEQFLKELL